MALNKEFMGTLDREIASLKDLFDRLPSTALFSAEDVGQPWIELKVRKRERWRSVGSSRVWPNNPSPIRSLIPQNRPRGRSLIRSPTRTLCRSHRSIRPMNGRLSIRSRPIPTCHECERRLVHHNKAPAPRCGVLPWPYKVESSTPAPVETAGTCAGAGMERLLFRTNLMWRPAASPRRSMSSRSCQSTKVLSSKH
jgi:hypothetical protein